MLFELVVRRCSAGLCGHVAGIRLIARNVFRNHGLLLRSVTGTHEHAEKARIDAAALARCYAREQNALGYR